MEVSATYRLDWTLYTRVHNSNFYKFCFVFLSFKFSVYISNVFDYHTVCCVLITSNGSNGRSLVVVSVDI